MLKYRLISGFFISVFFIALLLLAPAAWLTPFAVIFLAVAQLEFYGMLRAGKLPVDRVFGIGAGVLISLITCLLAGNKELLGHNASDWQLLAIALIPVLLVARFLFDAKCKKPVEAIGATLLGIIFIPVMMGFMIRVGMGWPEKIMGEHSTLGRLLLLYMIFAVKSADIGAYTVGRICGKHKMIPRISTAKTWEGLAGGVGFSLVISLIFWALAGDHFRAVIPTWWHAALLGPILALVGVYGDLSESMLKRHVGVKDSGNTIPGMGGLLDVLDSLIPAGPVLYAYLVWVV